MIWLPEIKDWMSQQIPFCPYIFLVKKTKTPCHYF